MTDIPETGTPVPNGAKALDPLAAVAKSGTGIVELFAFVTGGLVFLCGALTLFTPVPLHLLTGLEANAPSYAIAAQWAFFGLMLVFGAITKLRAISIFAAEFLFLSSLCVLAIFVWQDTGLFPIVIQFAIAALAFASSGLARITDKVEMTRDLKLTRQQMHALNQGSMTPIKD